MKQTHAITARIGITGRTEVLVFERRRAPGRYATVTLVVEQQGRGIIGAYDAAEIHAGERDELMLDAFPGGSREVALDVAQLHAARAVLMTRIAGRRVPAWLYERPQFLGNLRTQAADVYDVYLCGTCEHPLDGELQVARARAGGVGDHIICCAKCDGPMVQPGKGLATVHPWLARAILMLTAGEPRRALVYAAHAERQRLPASQLDGVRGEALLALSNPVQAATHLRRAVAADPDDARAERLLERAEAAIARMQVASAAVEAWAQAATATAARRRIPTSPFPEGARRASVWLGGV